MSDTVTLTWAELQQAAHVGCQRRLRALSRGRKDRYGAPTNDPWGIDIAAAMAEMAVAKRLDTYWADSPMPDKAGDVAAYHVRSTPRLDNRLILRPEDPDDRVFVLVCGLPPTFTLAGWILARDGKQEKYRSEADKGRPPCFLVPQTELHDIADLVYAATAV